MSPARCIEKPIVTSPRALHSFIAHEARSLALTDCAYCGGCGERAVAGRRKTVQCECVLRRAVRETMGRYHFCEHRMDIRSRLFRCDVEIAVRVLRPREQVIWELHLKWALPWEVCIADRRLRMDRANFFHRLYMTEQRLGRELLQRGIAPAEKYFDWGRSEARARNGSVNPVLRLAA